jgi:hypothetical protein
MLTEQEWRAVVYRGLALDTVDRNGREHDKLGLFAEQGGGSRATHAATARLGAPIKLTGHEISSARGHGIDMRQMRSGAAEYAKKHVVGVFTNKKANLRLKVRSRGINETIHHGGGPDKLRAIAALPEIARSGVVVYDGANPKNQKTRLVVLSKRVDIGGSPFVVTAGFRDSGSGALFYDHEMLDVRSASELLSAKPGSAALPGSLPGGSPARLNDYTTRFLMQEHHGESDRGNQ